MEGFPRYWECFKYSLLCNKAPARLRGLKQTYVPLSRDPVGWLALQLHVVQLRSPLQHSPLGTQLSFSRALPHIASRCAADQSELLHCRAPHLQRTAFQRDEPQWADMHRASRVHHGGQCSVALVEKLPVKEGADDPKLCTLGGGARLGPLCNSPSPEECWRLPLIRCMCCE